MPPSPLSDKLKALGVRLGARNLPSPEAYRRTPIEKVLQGNPWNTIHGEVFVVENHYPATWKMGKMPLFAECSLEKTAAWGGAPRISSFPPQSFAFLDTETNGLSGGSGTFAFLIGAGKFVEEEFHLAQFFLRDLDEEPAQLIALEEFLSTTQAIVTYNGKSFDIPLLDNRFTLQNWKSPFTKYIHLDLLHLARKIWRDRLPGCRLGDLECHILEVARADEEVPGWMVSERYLDYLTSGDAAPLKGVFYHNAMDILSLAALFYHTAQIITRPLDFSAHSQDLLSVGKLNEGLGYWEEAVEIYQAILGAHPDDEYLEAIRRLSFIYKRQVKISQAMKLWEEAAGLGEIYAFVELAKVYEHRFRAYNQALRWTRGAIEQVLAPGFPFLQRFQWQRELEHRLKRLEKKKKRRMTPKK